MIVNYRNEVWTPYKMESWSDEDEYLISNYGRIKRKKVTEDEWQLSKTSLVGGYPSFWIRKKGKSRTSSSYVHRAVANIYLKKREDQKFVIHLDFDKTNNEASNLKWANKEELKQHHTKNPELIKRKGEIKYSKLTEGRVRMIKRKIFDPNRRTRMRLIAKQFGISEMQLYRIKSGENWGHVKIDG
ncbi:HNH endonuclease [Lutibacter sp. B1]|uniref:HNH endonuclease n=1 Tax=Lutibacter sp. B1 TaxID=2725996 RepID=UPI001456A98B|nr:HNH endonuclease [Lutibacter sp. B1]NLP57126.1 HNH endonuclease [Lutibacter sp. B1]